KTLLCAILVAGNGRVKPGRIGYPPFDDEVDIDVLLLGGQIGLGRSIQGLQAAVEAQRLLHERQLEMQARLGVGMHDASELEQDSGLAFANDEYAVDGEEDYRGDGDTDERTHQRSPLSDSVAVMTAAASVDVRGGGAFAGTGICNRFLPPDRSMTFGVLPTTCCMVSR